VVATGLHMSNFDLIMLSAARRGGRFLGLSVPEPKGGYTWQNELRRRSGMELAPASVSSLRLALARLAEGGLVVTGIDRPDPGSKHRVNFFGRPAALPVLHVYLALKAGVPVILLSSVLNPDGIYRVMVSDPIPMQPHPDRGMEIVRNAERVLKVAEEMICTAPHTWAMFYPVWPEAAV
jgi:KDO2-lipid IV(A) lauroyltransferase